MNKEDRLAPSSLAIATVSLIVTLAWNGFFNNAFDYLAGRYFEQDGAQELTMRFIYALLMTLLAILVIRKLLK